MLAFDSVTVQHGNVRAVWEASFELRLGDVLCVSGECGAGKTTLLRLAAGLMFPDRGTVSLFGRNLAKLRRSSLAAVRRRVGVIPQEIDLLRDRTAADNVALAAQVRGLSGKNSAVAVDAALARVGLLDRAGARVDELSTGERQMLSVARALCGGPAILLADEPSSDVDDRRAGLIFDLIDERRRMGGVTILATHQTTMARVAAERGWRTVTMQRGALFDPTAEVPIPDNVVPLVVRAQEAG